MAHAKSAPVFTNETFWGFLMSCFRRSHSIRAFLNHSVLPACLALIILFTQITDSTPRTAANHHNTYPVSFLNDRARDITGAAAVNAPGFVVPGGLTGEGQLVAIADSGLDTGRLDDIHPDLQSTPGKMPKVVFLKSLAGRDVPDDPDGHGTHMAATIAGTGAASNGKFRGVAPGASIYFQAILNKDGEPEPPKNLADLFLPSYSAGARVHVDGWGGGPDVYLDSAAQVDEFVRNHPDFLVVFGAGNSGPSSGTITAEANSKNALSVGASVLPRPALAPGKDDTTSPADFSSRGPTGDGRIKPDLLAPGTGVISARSRLVEGNLPGYPDYTSMQGTSMAAAVTGGEATLLREYFNKYMKMPAPSAALVKAALINGARPGASGPSKEGFGVIDLAGTVIALKEGTFKLADEPAGVSQESERSYTFHVADTTAPFKATLAWSDPAAEPGSAQVLVNDLDLVVWTPDGRVYYGNHFLGNNTPDRTNNVEQVYLPSPVPGDYTVRVIGAGIRRNAVSGSATPSQDFALVWGQPPDESMVKNGDGRSITLADGDSFSPTKIPVVNLVNDSVAPVDTDHLFPGAEAYRTPLRAYLAVRLWRATGVKALNTAEGTVFTEINSDTRLGGYALASDGGGVMLNSSPAAPERLPPGVEISAVVNPLDQKIRQVRAAYTERDGVVAAVREEGGQKKIFMTGTGDSYRIADSAAYSYEDSYAGVETADMLFGTGALDELEEALPGMPVQLHLAPSTGEVQYLAVKRRVALGTVRETVPASGGIRLENGSSLRVFPGATVKKDRGISSFDAIKPGDHITAALLPDTGDAIGLVDFSSAIYGKAVDFTRKTRTLYLQDDNGRFRSIYLPPDAVIYRWGVRTTAEAITAGLRIRVITDPAGKEVWRLDIADTLYDKGALSGYDEVGGIVTAGEGKQYRVSGSTRFYKNGYPVAPGDLRPGENIELEYVTAPPPTGYVLLTVNARSAAPPPQLLASAVPLQGSVVVTGRTGSNTGVYVWVDGAGKQTVPVDESGKFNYFLQPDDTGGYDFTLVAVDRRTGGVTGRKITLAGDGNGQRSDYNSTVMGALSGVLTGSSVDVSPSRGGARYSPDALLTRAETAAILARLLNWPQTSGSSLPYSDAEVIPASYRPAVAEASAQGIFKGYPDGSFRPMGNLSRAEAALVLASVMSDLGIDIETTSTLPYTDAEDIPRWAVKAVAVTTTEGLLHGRQDELFAPADTVTVSEMAATLNHLLEICVTQYAGKWNKNR